jgi:hypothetical protein
MDVVTGSNGIIGNTQDTGSLIKSFKGADIVCHLTQKIIEESMIDQKLLNLHIYANIFFYHNK